jgi:hypothetical protein
MSVASLPPYHGRMLLALVVSRSTESFSLSRVFISTWIDITDDLGVSAFFYFSDQSWLTFALSTMDV